jgi:lichenan operon transcriptional antiterminator
MEARQTTFSVGIAKNSIRWGERRVNIVVLAAISQNDQQRF